MAVDDEGRGEIPFDPTYATAGPRRSTFTPPPASPAAAGASDDSVSDGDIHDDDELASALAADLGRIASPLTGPIVTPRPAAEPIRPDSPPPAMPGSDAASSDAPDAVPAAASSSDEPEAVPAATSLPFSGLDSRGDSSDAPEAQAVEADEPVRPVPVEPDLLTVAPPPAPESVIPGDAGLPRAPWSDLPAPDPTQAVTLPAAENPRPTRRSLTDQELLSLADGQDAGSRIEQLAEQLRLRDQEAREYRSWENSMLALGTPEALAAIRDVRGDFSDLFDGPTAPPPVPMPTTDIPLPFSAGPSAPAAESAPADEGPVAAAPPLPAWDVPPPSPTWSPAPEPDDEFEAPATEPAATEDPSASLPATEDAPDVASTIEIDPVDTAEPVDFAPAPSAPDAAQADSIEPDDIESEVIEAEVVVDDDRDGGDAITGDGNPESPFAPPPLVEPPYREGPPLLPSQAASTPPVVTSVPDFDSLLAAPDDRSEDAPDAVVEAELVADTPARPAAPISSFDDLLAGPEAEEEPPTRFDPEPTIAASAALFIEPLPVSAGESVPTETGSVAIIDPAYEEAADDVVADTDLVTVLAGGALLPPPVSPPSGPISTVRIPEDQTVILDDEPVAPRAFRVEPFGAEPTPLDQRVGRAARLFWLWFAANSSILGLGLGATVFAIGMSLRQAVVGILVGIAVSFLPLGLTTLMGKRSGQPTMIVSRASFGHFGNVLPSVVALIGRVFWGGVMLWLAASGITVVLAGAGLTGGLSEALLLLTCLAVLAAVVVVAAVFGYGLIARMQLVISILSAILVVGFIVLTWGSVNLEQALTVPDASWLRAVAAAVLVFSVVGLVWVNSGSDLARYQRPGSSGGSSMLWASFGAGLPAFVLVAYGALLAASNKGIASGFASAPLETLAMMLPRWYPVPLLLAAALSLASGAIVSLYSGAFALQAVNLRLPRVGAVAVVAVLLVGLAALIALTLPGGLTDILRDGATTLAVPTAAWAGIVASETMIRNRRFESASLVSRGGVYADWRWANVIGLVVISAIGFGLTTATVGWLSWQGFVFDFFGVPRDGDLAVTDLGVLVALGLGVLLPIVVGIPAIRRQEEARVP